MDPALLVPLGVALIGSLGGYLLAVRRASGSVGQSTAEELWAESRSIRQDYARRINELNEVVTRCDDRIDALEEALRKAHEENGNLKRALNEMEKTIDLLRETIHRLEEENSQLRQDNIRLRGRVNELEVNGAKS